MVKRLKVQRTKGWRMPAGAVYVGRPTKWGNPFRATARRTRAQTVALYRAWIKRPEQADLRAAIRRELAGKTLVCWCPLDGPCHADVLLEMARVANDQ